MLNSTPKNSLGYFKNPEKSKLLNVIDYTITSFCTSIGFKKGYFSVFLPYSDTQFQKYINPNDDSHNLKITDLELILDNLPTTYQKIILDSICQKYSFVCVDSASSSDLYSSLENVLLYVTATNGSLTQTFLDAMKDGNINDFEKQQLKSIAYKLREFLITFENRILETK